MKRIIVLFIVIFLISGCSVNSSNKKYQKLEKNFTEMAEKYYDEVGKNKVIGVDQYTIFITTLENSGYDTSELVDPTTKEACNKESSVTITISDSKKGYETKVNLICGSYKTEEK